MGAEGSDVSTGLAFHPDDSKFLLGIILDEFGLVNGSDSQDSFDSRKSWWFLEN